MAHMNRSPLSTTVNSHNSSSSLVAPSMRSLVGSEVRAKIQPASSVTRQHRRQDRSCRRAALHCNPLLSTLLKSNRIFFTAPRLPIHVRWNRWLSRYTSVIAACRSVSWQSCTFAAHEMSLILTSRCFHGTPWPQFDVKCCSVPALRCQHRCLRSLLSEGSVSVAPIT